MSTTDPKPAPSFPDLPSLVDDIPPPPPPRGTKQGRGPTAAELRLRAVMKRARIASERRAVRRVTAVAAAVLLILGGSWLIVSLIPRPVPNYLQDPMDRILEFTFLTDDFNKLPLDRRLALIKDLIERLKNSSAEDSMLMAAFATRVKAEARKQLEENAQRLAMDMLDSYAMDYATVPVDNRADFLDSKAIEFTRLMEDLTGERLGLSDNDSERLAQLKRQAQRDEQRLLERSGPMERDRVANFLRFLHDSPAQQTSLQQQARMTHFTRDMVRHLRGQNIATGRPR